LTRGTVRRAQTDRKEKRQMKHIRTTIVGLLLLAACGTAFASLVFPTVTLVTYDPIEFTYVYRIECPANMSYPFGYFQVDAQVPEDGEFAPWQVSGPFVPDTEGTNVNWASGISVWQYDPDERDFAYWRASKKQEIMPGTAWSGDFVLVVPNTGPGPGFVLTKDGVLGSTNRLEYLVPSPMVPEPANIVGLATGLMLAFGSMLRRRS